MKKLHLMILGQILLLTLSSPLNAQVLPLKPMYATDVLVTDMNVRNVTKTKVAVAENGFIYVLAFIDIDFYREKSWLVYKSADDGKTFQVICSRTYGYDYIALADVDFVVTGFTPNDINVFVAEVGNPGTPGSHSAYCMVTKYKANGDSVGVVYNYDWGANTTMNVSIATDFRSPDQSYSNPYTVAIAWTGSALLGNADHLTYAVSVDGGSTFTDHFLYNQPWPKHLGRVSLALGSSPGAFSVFTGMFGVAFEMNKTGETGDIGLIMNYPDLSGAWTNPVIFSAVGAYSFPSLAVRQKVPLVFPSTDRFSMMLSFNSPDMIELYTMDSTLVTAGWPQMDWQDFNFGGIGYHSSDTVKDCRVVYNKNDESYLLTYQTRVSNELRYVSIKANTPSNVTEKGNYRDLNTKMTWKAFPSVDVNLKKNKACFSWTDEPGGNFQSTLFDSEWSTVGISETTEISGLFSFYPNPAKNMIFLNYTGKERAEASVITSEGKVLKRFSIDCGSQNVDLSGISPGIYLLKVAPEASQPEFRKLIIRQ
jgi:Secretion system C-terminal sorting domain